MKRNPNDAADDASDDASDDAGEEKIRNVSLAKPKTSSGDDGEARPNGAGCGSVRKEKQQQHGLKIRPSQEELFQQQRYWAALPPLQTPTIEDAPGWPGAAATGCCCSSSICALPARAQLMEVPYGT